IVAELQRAGKLPAEPLVLSGASRVHEGAFVRADLDEPVAAAGDAAGPGVVTDAVTSIHAADQVIPDDLIVQGSLCVGFDCVNNEPFGFDTIRLKENNTRILFMDTSVGTFPTNDWQLVANDSASGGVNKFSIEDVTGARLPVTVEAGAAANSVYVDSTSRVGFRTSTPVLDLHVNTSNTPALRLEQNNSGGFTAQTWDVAGNEANFFVRDVTSGSRLSLRIRPGAPTSSVDIAADGDVGIGTASPTAQLHVRRTDGTASALVEEASTTAATRTLMTVRNNGQTRFVIHNTAAAVPAAGGYFFAHFDNGSFVIRPSGGGVGLFMDANGHVTTEGNLTVNGIFSNPSSRTLKENFQPLDPQEVLARFVEVPITEWSYKGDEMRHVGPVTEDFHAAFGLGTTGTGGIIPLDVQGVTMAAVQGLYQVVEAKDAELEALQAENAELAARLAALEQLVRKLAQ
ncbi:MAG: tail fiber domain-containing protein, partial [Chloroflexi bacterium]|nr:tail fiber domain-containing protein [Chloroflexota bacterium]